MQGEAPWTIRWHTYHSPSFTLGAMIFDLIANQRESYTTGQTPSSSWRLQQLGLDPGYVKMCCPSTYEDLERVCASCKSRRLCARDLARGDVESGMRSYCPGSPTIDALVVNWVL